MDSENYEEIYWLQKNINLLKKEIGVKEII